MAQSSNDKAMSGIIKPLDEISELIESCRSSKRGSNEAIFSNILKLTNQVKNNLISHLSKCLDNRISMQSDKQESITNSDRNLRETDKKKPELYSKILIKSGTAKKDSKVKFNLLEKVDKTLIDKKIDASIVGASSTSKGDVIINFKKDNDIDTIVKELEKSDKDIFNNRVTTIKPILPKVSITNIPMYYDLSNFSNIKTDIINSNPYLASEISKPNFVFEPLFKYSTKKHTQTIIVKCSSEIRSLIKSNCDELKLKSIVCKIFDHFHIKICSKCGKIGHLKNVCESQLTKCTFCSKDHCFKECPVKNDPAKYSCINCTSNKNCYSSNHSCFSYTCPLVIKAKQNLFQQTQNFDIENSQL